MPILDAAATAFDPARKLLQTRGRCRVAAHPAIERTRATG